jgi:predicted HicB family RNase H-like nuclease
MSMTKKKHKTMCVTMTAEEHAALRRMAKRDGFSMSGWLGQAVRHAAGVNMPERRGRGIHLQNGNE